MIRLFQIVVSTWVLFYIGWALFSRDMDFLERLALGLIVTGFFTAVGTLLVRRLPIVRFLLLVAVIGRIFFLYGEANLSMFEYYDYSSMVTDPSTGWAANISLLLDGLILVMAYLTPVAEGFDAHRSPPRTRIGAIIAVFTRSDGAMITSALALILLAFVVNQFVIGERYAEGSPRAIVARAPETIKAAEASGNEDRLGTTYAELGDAYWLLRKREKAASMYEKFVVLDTKDPYLSSYALSDAVVRLVQFYATEPDARFGDGEKALAMAVRLPEHLREAAYYDAVAAVYARLGQMDKAIEYQEIAVNRCTSNGYCCEERWEYAYHLEQYTHTAD